MTRQGRRLLAGLCMFSLAGIAAGQEPAFMGVPMDGTATADQVDALVARVEARSDIDEDTRNAVLEQLREAAAQVENRLNAQTAAAAYAAALEDAPAETAALRAELDEEDASEMSAERLGITSRTPLETLEQRYAQAQAELARLDATLTSLESQIAAEEARPGAAREEIAARRRVREDLAATVAPADLRGQPEMLDDAGSLARSLRLAAHDAEIARLEQELLSNSVRRNLLNARRDLTARERLQAERRLGILRNEVNDRRESAAMLAQQAAAAAELAAADKHPAVRALAEGNVLLTSELPEIANAIRRATEQLEQVTSESRAIEERLSRSRQRIEIGGHSRATGLLLVEERRSLPSMARHRAASSTRSELLAEIGLAQLRIQEERRDLSALDARIEQEMAAIAGDGSDDEAVAGIRAEIRLLLGDRRALLTQAENTYSNYLRVLSDLNAAQIRLVNAAEAYTAFLNEHQLWIPSAPILFFGDTGGTLRAAAWLLSPGSWSETFAALASGLSDNAGYAVTAVVVLVLLLLALRPLGHWFRRISRRVGRLATDHIGLTVASLFITAVRCSPVPLLIATAGLFLRSSPASTPFSDAVATSLLAVAPFLYNLLLFRALSERKGVLQLHFRWQENNLAEIRRQLGRLIVLGAPLVFFVVLLYNSDVAADRSTLGRAALIGLMLLLIRVLHPLLHPGRGVVADYYRKRPAQWSSRSRWLWYVLATAGPVLLILLSVFGYLYTSLIVTALLVDTIWLGLVLVLLNLLVLRWLVLTHRKLALRQILEERAAKRAEKEKEDQPDEDADPAAVASAPLDLDEVDMQSRKLLRAVMILIAIVGIWAIWADVLPAFNLFRSVELWTTTELLDGISTVAPVTLADAALALLVAAATAVAARNLPGLMEIAILQRMDLQPGSNYAVNTLLRYVILTVGTVTVLDLVGWNWSQIQWLVAALSVGLGFGLQEIVANFVSGLIVLFERPVRVGDTVTVGQVTGKVARVRSRATTITDWDRKEIVVPNKAFITEQVINWTLSDPITRITIPVGVAYGTDVELAHRVMEQTLTSLPLVLDEPPPKVYFVGFGDSSLDFRLNVYSRQLADRLPLTHAVHEAILRALSENDIEIPFPQRDLHIRSTVETGGEKARAGSQRL